MAKRGRRPGFVMSDEHRGKIKTVAILNALAEHALGRRKMGSSQVTAGLGLLKKVLPDLESVESNVTGDHRVQVLSSNPMSADDWERQYGEQPDGSDLGAAGGTTESAH